MLGKKLKRKIKISGIIFRTVPMAKGMTKSYTKLIKQEIWSLKFSIKPKERKVSRILLLKEEMLNILSGSNCN